ncbi:MAG: flagellar motor switch protein FliN [Desulfobacteraceae bacterium 4572_130]|nr:MAG: flagellar motor switch protein FliN [Desulfobacteraceae bacterium 4572_130]
MQETKKENTRNIEKKIRKKEFKKNVTKKEELKTTARKEAKKEITKNIKKKNELDFILDIPLQLSVELGKTKMLVNDLLQLGQGSIIELNKMSGEPLEVYINGKLIAKGEVVVVNEKFGIRLTDIITPMDRVKSLST